MATGNISTNIGGVSRSKPITRTGTVVTHNETLAAGKAAALIAKSTNATFLFGEDSAITSGNVDVAWVDANGLNCARFGMTYAAADESETHELELVTASGVGDALPTASASLHTYDDLVIDVADNTVVTSEGRPFVAADVGRLLKITAGTGFTADSYYIESVTDGAATLSAACGAEESSAGAGDIYDADYVCSVRTSVGFTIPGSSVKMISLYSEPVAGETASRAVVDFCSGSSVSQWAADLNDNEPFLWSHNSPIDNPIVGDSITSIDMSSLTTSTPTVYLEIVYDASP